MFKSSILAAAVAFLAVLSVAPSTEAHASMRYPCTRGNPACRSALAKGQSIDYNINSPIGVHSRKDAPLCKQKVPSAIRTKVRAGSNLKTTYSVGASHGGGHCQWALSYDNGKTWIVLRTMFRDCLKGVKGGAPYSVS
ncbi:hypothetical protein BX616_009474, partial [Lobosporangium transversale]